MFATNLWKIVRRNYGSLVEETGVGSPASEISVAAFFGAVPILLGSWFGYAIPIWTGFIGSLVPVVGVLTGFSINSIVLLSGQSDEDSYEQRKAAIRQTKDFSLYSILVGIVLLSALTVGFLLAKANPGAQIVIFDTVVTALQIASVAVYTILIHYLIVLLLITHRLFTMVHIDAVG
ncbi:hypothetical protein [Salarchaeum japonicum]|uniref:Uncharacterized protein n=1 Tax=Salarchaeum japonicum TaxID=555573 RepID=A0AAV3T076_9EURY|nr:hypothetical protein [Salarchaeum japonicum]